MPEVYKTEIKHALKCHARCIPLPLEPSLSLRRTGSPEPFLLSRLSPEGSYCSHYWQNSSSESPELREARGGGAQPCPWPCEWAGVSLPRGGARGLTCGSGLLTDLLLAACAVKSKCQDYKGLPLVMLTLQLPAALCAILALGPLGHPRMLRNGDC